MHEQFLHRLGLRRHSDKGNINSWHLYIYFITFGNRNQEIAITYKITVKTKLVLKEQIIVDMRLTAEKFNRAYPTVC